LSENSRKSWFWFLLAWFLGVLGMIGIWLSVSIRFDRACMWMGILAVVDIALVLRFTGVQAGWGRLLATLIGAATITVTSQWLIAANAFGMVLGLLPFESAHMVGPVLVWEFSRLRMSDADVIYTAATLFLAWYMGFHRPK